MPLQKNPFKKQIGKPKFEGRYYKEPDGIYLSVTSIINPEPLDFPGDLLEQYAARGTIIHAQVEEYLKTGIMPIAEATGLEKEIKLVQEGSLGLQLNDCNPAGFFEEYGKHIECHEVEMKVMNRKYRYGGRLDFSGTFHGKPSIFDVKTAGTYTRSKTISYFMQLAAYASCFPEPIEQLVIIPLTPKAKKGYAPPLIETNVNKYFKEFLKQFDFVKKNYEFPFKW